MMAAAKITFLLTSSRVSLRKISKRNKEREHGRKAEKERNLLTKFTQNDELRRKILDTGDAYLVECAGVDKTWTCGIRLDDERRFDASQWKGTNISGFALMRGRDELRKNTEG